MKKIIKIILCILIGLFILTGGFYATRYIIDYYNQKEYSRVDKRIELFFAENNLSNLEIDEKRELIDSFLQVLEDDNDISELQYDEIQQKYIFTYKSGILGAISLKNTDDEIAPCFSSRNGFATYQVNNITHDMYSKIDLNSSLNNDIVNVELVYFLDNTYDSYFNDINDEWDSNTVKFSKNTNATVDTLRKLHNKELYILAMHGTEYNGRIGLTFREDGRKLKYWNDLRKQDIAKEWNEKGEQWYIVFPSFFKNNYSKGAFKGSVVIIESCCFFGCDCSNKGIYSGYSDVFTDYLKVDAVLGFRNTVLASYASDITKTVLDNMLINGSCIQDALNNAIERYGNDDSCEDIDRDKYKAYPVLVGVLNKKLVDNVGENDKQNSSEDNLESVEDDSKESVTEDINGGGEYKLVGSEYAEMVYEELLDNYLVKRDKYIAGGKKYDDMALDYLWGEHAIGNYNIFLMDGGFDDAGYKITDLDGDGIYELIIASLSSSKIYDLYTMEGVEPKLVLSSWERCSVNYCGDYFYSIGSNGASSQSASRYKFNGDIETIDMVYTEYFEEMNDVKFYYSNVSESNTEVVEEISNEQYEQYKEESEREFCIVPDLISFSEFIANHQD